MTRNTLILAAASLMLPAGVAAQTATVGAQAGAAPAATAQAASATDATAPTPAAGAVVAATQADFKAGSTVLDAKGATVGTIEKVTAAGAVVSTGTVRAEIPLASFGKSDKGLVIAMTKAELEAAAKGS